MATATQTLQNFIDGEFVDPAEGRTQAVVMGLVPASVQKVIDALVAEENARIDESVTSGRLIQGQADARKATTAERVTERVNNVRPAPGRGRGGPGDGAMAPSA